MNTPNGFPLLSQLDSIRADYHTASHDAGPLTKRIGYWLGHKVLVIACVPTGALCTGFGLVGMVGTATIVGTLKVLIFAFTVGNVKPQFQTGFLWFAERSQHSVICVTSSLWEVAFDTADLIYQACKFVFERIEAGFEQAIKCEGDLPFHQRKPDVVQTINDLAKEDRIDWNSSERSMNTVMKHYAYSVASIPLNTLTCICASVASSILASIFVAKAFIYAATNLNIPLRTFLPETVITSLSCGVNAIEDSLTNFGDMFVIAYKIGCALRIHRIIAAPLDILRYIPEAYIN